MQRCSHTVVDLACVITWVGDMERDIEQPEAAATDRSGPLANVWPGQPDVDPHHGQHLVHHGYTVLLSNADGTITDAGRDGLLDHDTRVLSRYEIALDGAPPRVDSTGLIDASHWIARLTVARAGGDAHGPHLPQDALELTLRRAIGNGKRMMCAGGATGWQSGCSNTRPVGQRL